MLPWPAFFVFIFVLFLSVKKKNNFRLQKSINTVILIVFEYMKGPIEIIYLKKAQQLTELPITNSLPEIYVISWMNFVYIHIYIYIYVCVCVCVYIYIYTVCGWQYIYIYIYILHIYTYIYIYRYINIYISREREKEDELGLILFENI